MVYNTDEFMNHDGKPMITTIMIGRALSITSPWGLYLIGEKPKIEANPGYRYKPEELGRPRVMDIVDRFGEDEPLIIVDIGCNAGADHLLMRKILSEIIDGEGRYDSERVRIAGFDINPDLIEAAKNSNLRYTLRYDNREEAEEKIGSRLSSMLFDYVEEAFREDMTMKEEYSEMLDIHLGDIVRGMEGKYHIIVAAHVLQHVKNRRKALRNLYEALEEEGFLFTGTDFYVKREGRLVSVMGKEHLIINGCLDKMHTLESSLSEKEIIFE